MPVRMSDLPPRAQLDDEVKQALAELAEISVGPDSDFEEIRAGAITFGATLRGPVDPELRAIPTLDVMIDDVRARWYGPQPDADRDVVVFLHGGGWAVGDIDSYDDDVRLLAQVTGAAVVSVEYRRAPEHPYPAPLEDCLAVVRHAAGLPHRSLSLVGDSAGGNLVLGVAFELRAARLIDAVLALYPCVDPTGFANASYQENGTGYLLTEDAMRTYWDLYAPDHDARRDPRVALLLGDLRGMPPVVVASADYDPLRDENRALAARLAAADVDVTYLPNPGLTHGFQQMAPRVGAATRALDAAYAAYALALRRGIARRPTAAPVPARP